MARPFFFAVALSLAGSPCGGFRVPRGGVRPRGDVDVSARKKVQTETTVTIPEVVYNRQSAEEAMRPHVPHEFDTHVVQLTSLYLEPPETESKGNARRSRYEDLAMAQNLWKYAPYRLRSANNGTGLRGTGMGLCAWDLALLSKDGRDIEGNMFCARGQDAATLAAMAGTSPFARPGASERQETYLFKPNDAAELNWQWFRSPRVLVCLDKPDALELRKATRPAHLEYLMGLETVHQAGPLFRVGDEAAGPVGSLVLFSAPTLEEAMRVRDEDPYHQAGLFAETRLYPAAVHDVNGRNLVTRRSLDEGDPLRELMEDCEIAEHWDYPEKQIFYRTLTQDEAEAYQALKDEEPGEKVWEFDGQRLKQVPAAKLASIMEGEGTAAFQENEDEEVTAEVVLSESISEEDAASDEAESQA